MNARLGPRAAAASRQRPPTPLQALLDLPGRLAALVGGRPRPVRGAGHTGGVGPGAAPPSASLAALAGRVVASPRGNAYLSLEPGLRVFEHGGGLLTWAARGRAAFAVGGLHGPPEAHTALLTAWRAALRDAGFRRMLLFPVHAEGREAVHAAGFEPLMVGSEALVSPEGFSWAGKRKADLRQMVNRATRRYGVTCRELDPADACTDPALAAVWRRWLAERPSRHRMTLLVGTPGFDRPLGRRFFVAEAPPAMGGDGPRREVALLTLTPAWAGHGWGVDVMARAPDAPAGAMDALFDHALRALQAEGVGRLSLGACPMSERAPVPGGPRGSAHGDRPLLRFVFRRLERSRLGNRLFRFRTLDAFKRKFDPEWVPVHIACWPRASVWSLYIGCRMWGLFGPPRLDAPPTD